MNYGIITHYDVHNHGAILQLYALIKALEQRKVDAKALRFNKNYDFMGTALKNKYEVSIKSVAIYVDYLLKNGIAKTLFNIQKKRILDHFKNVNHLIGNYYSETDKLDAVIVGSDEVFALHTGPTPVFFGHACPANKIFSYAGSFGPTKYEDIEQLHCLPFVRSGLEAMKGISVRDKNSQDIVKQLTEKESVLVCDPVILYGYIEEIKNFPKLDLPPYLLVYAYDYNMNQPEEIAAIQSYAKKEGLLIVSPGFYHKWCDRNININPLQLLQYFSNAACVVTDTFHGSVMSIITNRNLAVKIRGNGNKLHNLLEEYNLIDRIVDDNLNLDTVFAQNIDFDKLTNEVENRRNSSMEFLERMINL
jgi:hypothetical protein